MKFLILNTDYPEFLHWLYARKPGLEDQNYEQQMQARSESLFGVADFYSSNLRKLGHEAWEIHANNEWIQRAWARENNIAWKELRSHYLARGGRFFRRRLQRLLQGPSLPQSQPTWFYSMLSAQILHYKPDVILNQDLELIDSRFLKTFKPSTRLVVGQNASPLPSELDLSGYDLLLSSLPNRVEQFRKQGIPAELHPFAFEPRILEAIAKDSQRQIPVSFVGSVSQDHGKRIELLQQLSSKVDIQIWGHAFQNLPQASTVRNHYKGNAWGIEMYEILRDSRMTLNHHIDLAGPYANNMRLYEATGMGSLLITDWKENLNQIFESGSEVVAYRTPEECVRLIQYYLDHENEAKRIAAAGQKRTLRQHTYLQRMEELSHTIQNHLP